MATNNKIQKDIIEVLREKKECAFGDILKDSEHSYHDLLSNLLKLRRKGKIKKLKNHKGYYSLTK